MEQKHFFDTITIDVGPMQNVILKSAINEGINLRKIGKSRIGISLDERTRPAIIEAVWRSFGIKRKDKDLTSSYRIPNELYRLTDFLTHPIFHMNRAESEMTRYMRRLADRDLALDRSMIPLGSCTMKLNSVAEMIPISWREFSEPHPFVPVEQMDGFRSLFTDLKNWLRSITGFSGVSLQPNAGAQGEYAGLMVIRKFHSSRGEKNRNVCLIPSSAHGTNPASAQMCGMEVSIVKCDKYGNVDIDHLKEKINEAGINLAALMITYPSTHGVFEEGIVEICNLIHDAGGQVYMDGANLNALVGIAKPGFFGPDVSHMNLHKT